MLGSLRVRLGEYGLDVGFEIILVHQAGINSCNPAATIYEKGMFSMPYFLAIVSSPSTTRYGTLATLMNGFTTFQPSPSSETPTTTSPFDWYLRWNSENHGISSLHP